MTNPRADVIHACCWVQAAMFSPWPRWNNSCCYTLPACWKSLTKRESSITSIHALPTATSPWFTDRQCDLRLTQQCGVLIFKGNLAVFSDCHLWLLLVKGVLTKFQNVRIPRLIFKDFRTPLASKFQLCYSSRWKDAANWSFEHPWYATVISVVKTTEATIHE